MSFPNTLHFDPDIFQDPETFQYDRFIDHTAKAKNGKSLHSSHSRPFGGGIHLRPDRKFISYEARAMVAMMLLQFDMRLPNGETIPDIDISKQGLNVSHPERDVKMEIRLRQDQ